jgi:hypothetical protein
MRAAGAPGDKETNVKTLFLSAVAATLLGAAFTSPVLAMNGAQALAKCLKVHNCAHHEGPDGGIIIFGPKGGVVTCPSRTAQCTATPRQGAASTRQDSIVDQSLGV